jgi:hypothetical protein
MDASGRRRTRDGAADSGRPPLGLKIAVQRAAGELPDREGALDSLREVMGLQIRVLALAARLRMRAVAHKPHASPTAE